MASSRPASTVDAFNKTFRDFLEELVECCPDAPGVSKLAVFLTSFDTVVMAAPRSLMDGFMQTMSPHAALIHTKDPTLFEIASLPGSVSLKEAWDTMSGTTRDAVWQYLQMLYLLASTASAIPPEMLSAIEGVASQYADNIQSGNMDIGAAANMLMGMDLSSVMSGLGGLGGLGSLASGLGGLGGLGALPGPSDPPSRSESRPKKKK